MTTAAAPRPAPAVPTVAAGAATPSRARVLVAFAIVYVLWGSTYLAMRIALEGIPPLALGGVRFTVAGLLLGGWLALRERPAWPTRREWGWALLTGLLLMVGGNLGVLLAETRITSGAAALLAASLAIWMVLLDWLRPGGTRPRALVALGVVVGLGGVALLVGPEAIAGGHAAPIAPSAPGAPAAPAAGGVDPIGAALVLGGSLAWAVGSLLARSPSAPRSPLVGAAMQMLCGGGLLLAGAALHGDLAHVAPATWGVRPGAALLYLVVCGSLVGFTAYIWLMRHVAAAKVATYAYVNPVVAVFLGWAILGEPVGWRTLAAAGVIVAAVALITVGRARGPAA